jgi:hypothetical protein
LQARSHNAVAAAVAQGRADWGVAIAPVARDYGLGFLPLIEEHVEEGEERRERRLVPPGRPVGEVVVLLDQRQEAEGWSTATRAPARARWSRAC